MRILREFCLVGTRALLAPLSSSPPPLRPFCTQSHRKRKWDVAEPALGGGEQAGAPPAAAGAYPGAVAPPTYPPPPLPYGGQPALSVPPTPASDAGGLDATNPAAIAALATSRLNAMLASKGVAAPVPGVRHLSTRVRTHLTTKTKNVCVRHRRPCPCPCLCPCLCRRCHQPRMMGSLQRSRSTTVLPLCDIC
jgi:hypothetical protein